MDWTCARCALPSSSQGHLRATCWPPRPGGVTDGPWHMCCPAPHGCELDTPTTELLVIGDPS